VRSQEYAADMSSRDSRPNQSAQRTLYDLRDQLTKRQRAILDDVWGHMKEKRAGIPERTLLDDYGREVLTSETKALGGSIIYSGHEENRLRYKVGLVGVFLTTDGPRLESLVKRYLDYLRTRYQADKEIERLSSKEFASWGAQFAFSESELNELRMILSLSLRSFASRLGGWNPEEWFISVDDDVVELKRVTDWDEYVKGEIMKGYDARQPVGEAERIRYSGIVGSQHPYSRAFAQLEVPPTEPVADLDLAFIDDLPLLGIVESDWSEARRLIEIGAWKSCTILCGGILEALLLWRLEHAQRVVTLPSAGTSVDYGGLGLSELLRMCKEKDLLADEAVQLTEWARGYRNIVHPGNQRREGRNAGREHAAIALNLVSLVVKSFRSGRGR